MQNINLFISSEVDCMNGVSTEMSQKFTDYHNHFYLRDSFVFLFQNVYNNQ